MARIEVRVTGAAGGRGALTGCLLKQRAQLSGIHQSHLQLRGTMWWLL
ncbi:hypothetical protein OG754_39735 (plasmid) [Streptomyces decoyicus]|nr:hypothetical protein [Streptomyces decoyicus]